MVEEPYTGRARIDRLSDGLQIVIPVARQWVMIAIISIIVVSWITSIPAFEGFAFSGDLLRERLFSLVSLLFYILGSALGIQYLIWLIAGKEIITAENGLLTIRHTKLLLYRPKTYALDALSGLGIDEGQVLSDSTSMAPGGGGVIRFDYGMKTIRFGQNIDEAEGRYIIRELLDAGLVSAKQVIRPT
jgi:hypothetical protein